MHRPGKNLQARVRRAVRSGSSQYEVQIDNSPGEPVASHFHAHRPQVTIKSYLFGALSTGRFAPGGATRGAVGTTCSAPVADPDCCDVNCAPRGGAAFRTSGWSDCAGGAKALGGVSAPWA